MELSQCLSTSTTVSKITRVASFQIKTVNVAAPTIPDKSIMLSLSLDLADPTATISNARDTG
jgi:hypothetical protein